DGRGDPPLSDLGRAQAQAVADRLGAHARARAGVGGAIEAIYVTPLRRTSETAAPLAARLGIDPAVEPGFVEISLGEWEGGFYRARIADRDPLAVEVFARQRWDLIPGAESNEVVAERTGGALRRVAAAHPGGLVVVVSHAVAIGTLLSQATGASPFAFVLGDNANISRLVVDGERWLLRGYNDTAHLDGLRAELLEGVAH
ncbi:MAG TPA: histidine phosphatase family protein, partial [Acidimicrobiales bacterium]|nr:histidine phosphatase family protein [Acidimicrobiales bacterium]